jgi:hypothetical protein
VKKKDEPRYRHWIDRFESLRQCSARRSAAMLCRSVRLPYSTLRRCRTRRRAACPIRRKPGPAKSGALPVAEFRSRVAHLVHCPKLTRGSGLLVQDFRDALSRRRIQAFLASLRRRFNRRLRNAKLHVTWHLPNLAWAIDAMLLRTSAADPGVVVVLARDLASHFHFEPLVLPAESALDNLRWLRLLIARHGPPLFLKRDNGAPFNADIINDLLAERCILPINSPVRRPSYNGAIEHGVGSCKRAIFDALDPTQPVPEIHRLMPLLRSVIHLHNARPRRSLRGLSPARAYFDYQNASWSRTRRHEIFRWISARAESTLQTKWETSDHHSRAKAWRSAVVAWLRCQALITVSRKPQLSPIFANQKRS